MDAPTKCWVMVENVNSSKRGFLKCRFTKRDSSSTRSRLFATSIRDLINQFACCNLIKIFI